MDGERCVGQNLFSFSPTCTLLSVSLSQDIKGGVDHQYLAILRHSYEDRGRCSREDQPVQSRVSRWGSDGPRFVIDRRFGVGATSTLPLQYLSW